MTSPSFSPHALRTLFPGLFPRGLTLARLRRSQDQTGKRRSTFSYDQARNTPKHAEQGRWEAAAVTVVSKRRWGARGGELGAATAGGSEDRPTSWTGGEDENGRPDRRRRWWVTHPQSLGILTYATLPAWLKSVHLRFIGFIGAFGAGIG